MKMTIDLTPCGDSWKLLLDAPDVYWECPEISGRRAVQIVQAEVEALIDRTVKAERGLVVRHLDGNPRNLEPPNLRIETPPKSHGVGVSGPMARSRDTREGRWGRVAAGERTPGPWKVEGDGLIDLLAALRRAVVLMDATRRFIEDNPIAEYTVHFDEAECDGYCLADDCRSALESAHAAIAKAEGR